MAGSPRPPPHDHRPPPPPAPCGRALNLRSEPAVPSLPCGGPEAATPQGCVHIRTGVALTGSWLVRGGALPQDEGTRTLGRGQGLSAAQRGSLRTPLTCRALLLCGPPPATRHICRLNLSEWRLCHPPRVPQPHLPQGLPHARNTLPPRHHSVSSGILPGLAAHVTRPRFRPSPKPPVGTQGKLRQVGSTCCPLCSLPPAFLIPGCTKRCPPQRLGTCPRPPLRTSRHWVPSVPRSPADRPF